MLKQLDENLWVYEEEAVLLGFEIGARMTVIRLGLGGLFIHSPLDISPELKTEIDALGEVKFVVSPFNHHYLGLPGCARVYPNAAYYASPGLNPKKCPGVTFVGTLSGQAEPGWKDDLQQVYIRGNALDNEIVFCHPASKTVIATDLCFNIPASRGAFTKFMARLFGVYEKFSPSLGFKIFTRNRTLVRESIDKILAWDFDRVIISHGDIIETGGKEKLRAAFTWLRR